MLNSANNESSVFMAKSGKVFENVSHESSIFLAKGGRNAFFSSNSRFNPQGKKPVCSYCGTSGHTIDKCYKKHGYPQVIHPKTDNRIKIC